MFSHSRIEAKENDSQDDGDQQINWVSIDPLDEK
jgi:hypothetical protein